MKSLLYKCKFAYYTFKIKYDAIKSEVKGSEYLHLNSRSTYLLFLMFDHDHFISLFCYITDILFPNLQQQN